MTFYSLKKLDSITFISHLKIYKTFFLSLILELEIRTKIFIYILGKSFVTLQTLLCKIYNVY